MCLGPSLAYQGARTQLSRKSFSKTNSRKPPVNTSSNAGRGVEAKTENLFLHCLTQTQSGWAGAVLSYPLRARTMVAGCDKCSAPLTALGNEQAALGGIWGHRPGP